MELLNDLVENLQAQINAHNELLLALEAEISLSASCTLIQLQDVHQERDRSSKQIRSLEVARQHIIQGIVTAKQITEEISISVIMKFCEKKIGQHLEECRNKLLIIVKQIKKVGRSAAEKAILRSNCIKEVHNAIHKRFKRVTYYSGTGKLAQPQGACILKRAI